MKYKNLNKNRSILLAHDLITRLGLEKYNNADYHYLAFSRPMSGSEATPSFSRKFVDWPTVNPEKNKGNRISKFSESQRQRAVLEEGSAQRNKNGQWPSFLEKKERKPRLERTSKAATHSEWNRLNFIDSIEVVSNMDFKPYRGVSYNSEDGQSAKISSKLKLLLTFYLLNKITGQLPYFIRAKKSVANFNLRAGMDVGVKVTLRTKAFERFYKNLNLIMLPVKGTKSFQTPNKEKDYSILSLSFIQPLNGYIILKDAWLTYKSFEAESWKNSVFNPNIINYEIEADLSMKNTKTAAINLTKKRALPQSSRRGLSEEIKELINISNKIKLEQEQIGAHLRFNINSKIYNKHPEMKGFILNYFLIPGSG